MNKLANTVIVGSRAIPGLTRRPKDLDVITTDEGFREMVARAGLHHRLKETRSTRTGKAAIFDGLIIDAEIVEDSPLHAARALELGLRDSVLDSAFFNTTIPIASPCMVYTLKMSHRYLKNSPHFLKTMQDIWHLRLAGHDKIVDEDFYAARMKETYNYGHPNLKTTKDAFFKDDFYIYDHDSIHRAVAVEDVPAYTRYMVDGEQVLTSRAKFDALPIQVRLNGVLEESYVLALERAVIPHNANPVNAFKIALSKVCTSITSGWFREFAWENYYQVASLFNVNYVEKFEAAKARGEILPFSRETSTY